MFSDKWQGYFSRLGEVTFKLHNVVPFVYARCDSEAARRTVGERGGGGGGCRVRSKSVGDTLGSPSGGLLYLSGEWRQAPLCIRWYRFVVGEVCRLRAAYIRPIAHAVTRPRGARLAHSKLIFGPRWKLALVDTRCPRRNSLCYLFDHEQFLFVQRGPRI